MIQRFECDGNQNGIHQIERAANNLKKSMKYNFWF